MWLNTNLSSRSPPPPPVPCRQVSNSVSSPCEPSIARFHFLTGCARLCRGWAMGTDAALIIVHEASAVSARMQRRGQPCRACSHITYAYTSTTRPYAVPCSIITVLKQLTSLNDFSKRHISPKTSPHLCSNLTTSQQTVVLAMQDHPPAQDRDTFDLPPADRTIEHVSFAIARELGEAGRLSDFCLESGRWFANGTLICLH